jgi:oligopeptide transport system substrate-binding protein
MPTTININIKRHCKVYKTFQSYCVFSIIALIFCSCQNPAQLPETRTSFRYNQHNAITSLDPAFAKSQNNIWAVDCLFNGLLQLDDSLKLRPSIAKSWDISTDAKTYIFHLRNDVFFHDNPVFEGGKGRKVTANDVKYSFERLIDTKLSSPGSWIFKDRVVVDSAFLAPNDSTFVLRLVQPFQPLLQILTMQYASIVPNEAIDKYGSEFRNHPVGTGPFQFKIWAENQGLVVVKNPNYFEFDAQGERLPYLDAVKTSFISDRKTAFLELKKGNLDFFFGLESSYINELLTSDGELLDNLQNKFNFNKNPYLNTEYLGIKLDSKATSPLQQQKIRQALNYGFDRAKMLKTLRNNVGKPAISGFTPRGLPSYDDKLVLGYNFDPEKSKRLLKEAGFPNGKNLPEITLLCDQTYLDLCTFITRQWEDLGIKVKVEVSEIATLRERMRKGTAPFFRASWIADYPDAESFLTCFYGKNTPPPNYTTFKNEKFDLLYEQSLSETDVEKRYYLYREMDKIVIEEAPVVFLFYDETAQFYSKNISGLSKNAINLLSLKRVRKNIK